MTEEKRALEQILTAKKRSGLYIEEIKTADAPDRDYVREKISGFILTRYFLEDEDVSGLSFDEIAEKSVAKSANISSSMVKELDTSVDCMGASSVTAKKAMLFRQIEKLLDITFPAMQTAWVETLNDIGDLVYNELIKKKTMSLDIDAVRKEYAILGTMSYGKPLIYLDNAATTQVPQRVLDSILQYYRTSCANVHRGAHRLSEDATAQLEAVRKKTAVFIGAEDARNVVFTSGATASVNMAAQMLAEQHVFERCNVVVSQLEHHSNFVPWQQVCKKIGAQLRVAPITEDGQIDMTALCRLIDRDTAVVAVTAVSNVLGTVAPVKEIVDLAHNEGAVVLVDAAQAMRCNMIDVNKLGCDLLCFSGHKMMAPTGTGVLYIRDSLIDELQPAVFGGGMIDSVSAEETVFAQAPARYEAGTPNTAGIIGLGAAIDYLESIGIDKISEYEDRLLMHAEEGLRSIEEVKVFGSPGNRHGCLSFEIRGLHSYDTAALLDRLGICVRAGHHCAQPLIDTLGVSGTVRVSPAFYNTEAEIDRFCEAIKKIISINVLQ